MLIVYECKKTGQVVEIDTDKLPIQSREYGLRKGIREYMDNYHASETLKKHNGDAAKVKAAVEPMVTEAFDRLMAGDVPGEAVIDPFVLELRKLAAGMTPEQKTAFLADLAGKTPAAPRKPKAA